MSIIKRNYGSTFDFHCFVSRTMKENENCNMYYELLKTLVSKYDTYIKTIQRCVSDKSMKK